MNNIRVIICLILFWGFESLTFSQYCSFRKFNWTSIEKNVNDSIKLSFIKRANVNDNKYIKNVLDTSYFYNKDSAIHYYKRELGKFHILDFNGDKLFDLVYDKLTGDVPVVIFFLNLGDSLTNVFETIGYVENIIIRNNKISAMRIVIPPCCCPFSFLRVYYIFRTLPCNIHDSNNKNYCSRNHSNLFKYQRIAVEELGCYLLPENDNLNEEFVSNQDFYLTTTPEPILNKTIPDQVDCTYGMPFNNTNQIAKFGVYSKGIIRSNQTSKDGIMFSFIKIKNKQSKQSVFRKSDCYIYGWTQTKNLTN